MSEYSYLNHVEIIKVKASMYTKLSRMCNVCRKIWYEYVRYLLLHSIQNYGSRIDLNGNAKEYKNVIMKNHDERYLYSAAINDVLNSAGWYVVTQFKSLMALYHNDKKLSDKTLAYCLQKHPSKKLSNFNPVYPYIPIGLNSRLTDTTPGERQVKIPKIGQVKLNLPTAPEGSKIVGYRAVPAFRDERTGIYYIRVTVLYRFPDRDSDGYYILRRKENSNAA